MITTENLDEVRLLQEYRKAVRGESSARLEAFVRRGQLQRIAVSVVTTAYVRNHREQVPLTGSDQT